MSWLPVDPRLLRSIPDRKGNSHAWRKLLSGAVQLCLESALRIMTHRRFQATFVVTDMITHRSVVDPALTADGV